MSLTLTFQQCRNVWHKRLEYAGFQVFYLAGE